MSSPTAELSPLSLHDALPIWEPAPRCDVMLQGYVVGRIVLLHQAVPIGAAEIENVVRILLEEREIVPHRFREIRSEEHTSELQSRFDLVCRLLLEKKKINENK